MAKKESIEIEARFLEIDVKKLIECLVAVGAQDLGKSLLKETIFYDKSLSWRDRQKMVRLRMVKGKVYLTYKHRRETAIDGTEELEILVSDYTITKKILEKTGLIAFREQEKLRHTFIVDGVHVDIDIWPQLPAYVEIEGDSEECVKAVASKLNLKWEDAVFDDARAIIENHYKIPVSKMRIFTFEKCD